VARVRIEETEVARTRLVLEQELKNLRLHEQDWY